MDNYQALIKKVEKVTKEKKLDLSSGEDLSIGIMNLIAIEEHLFFSAQKTGKKEYLNLLDEVRKMRVDLLKEIIKDYEGEVWCISKHLLAASMRLMEVGTKELKKGDGVKATKMFENSYKLYSLFWGLNTKMVNLGEVKRNVKDVYFVDDKGTSPEQSEGKKFEKVSIFSKLNDFIQKALDCCRE
jgi:hypothetical protein